VEVLEWHPVSVALLYQVLAMDLWRPQVHSLVVTVVALGLAVEVWAL
jgi:hypothetical protein